jgi:hypothetical protein
MPFSRQQLRVDPVGHEDAVRPRLRWQPSIGASRSRGGPPRSRRCSGPIGSAAPPRWHRNLALTAESYQRARIVVEHVLAPELAAPLTLLAARYA